MKHKRRTVRWSLSGGALLLAAVRDLLAEVRGTGQTVTDMLRAGWSYTEIHRYFPWDRLSVVFLIAAMGWFVLSARSGRRERRA